MCWTRKKQKTAKDPPETGLQTTRTTDPPKKTSRESTEQQQPEQKKSVLKSAVARSETLPVVVDQPRLMKARREITGTRDGSDPEYKTLRLDDEDKEDWQSSKVVKMSRESHEDRKTTTKSTGKSFTL